MFNLKSLFKNHFDTKKISDVHLEKFTDDHIHRLTNNNTGGKYTALITATQNAYNTYFGAMTSKDSKYSTQQAKTQTVDAIIEAFKKAVKKQEGLLSVKLDEGSPDYNKFYPQGKAEYSHATKSTVKILMERFVVFGAEYEAQLGGEFLQIFETLYDQYKTIRGQQLDAIDLTDAERHTTSVKRDVVERQLMINALTLAIEYLGEPDMVEVFFDQTIIRADESGSETFWEGNINASATVTIVEREFATGTQLVLRNTGAAQLSFCLAPAEGIACGEIATVVDGMSEKQIGVDDLGNIVNMFLNVTNMNVNEEGRFEAEIVS
ncbi:MAG: hypothetical protein AAB071_07665 [Bacteroidota bacterium]